MTSTRGTAWGNLQAHLWAARRCAPSWTARRSPELWQSWLPALDAPFRMLPRSLANSCHAGWPWPPSVRLLLRSQTLFDAVAFCGPATRGASGEEVQGTAYGQSLAGRNHILWTNCRSWHSRCKSVFLLLLCTPLCSFCCNCPFCIQTYVCVALRLF